MRVLLIAAMSLALGAPAAEPVNAQGPVRQGLRRTGEVVVDGTGRVIQGAGRVVQGAGRAVGGVAQGAADVTRGVVGGAADVTRGVVQGAARGMARTADALTPNIPLQARAGATLSAADQARDARWRFQQHHGEWWYYTPQNTWMYHRDGRWNSFAQDSFQANPAFAGQYATGYRGVAGGAAYADQNAQGYQQAQGPVYTLHRDQYGREFICDSGQRVYFDNQGGRHDYGAGYRGMDGQESPGQQPMTPTPAIPTDPNAPGSTELQGQTGAPTQGTTVQAGAEATVPATPTPQESGQSDQGAAEPGQTAQ
jgi:hypothetical protein